MYENSHSCVFMYMNGTRLIINKAGKLKHHNQAYFYSKKNKEQNTITIKQGSSFWGANAHISS